MDKNESLGKGGEMVPPVAIVSNRMKETYQVLRLSVGRVLYTIELT